MLRQIIFTLLLSSMELKLTCDILRPSGFSLLSVESVHAIFFTWFLIPLLMMTFDPDHILIINPDLLSLRLELKLFGFKC
jgi:hypothetical protein